MTLTHSCVNLRNLILTYRAKKTGKTHRVPIGKKAIKILSKYESQGPFLFPLCQMKEEVFDQQREVSLKGDLYNRLLRRLEAKMGLTKQLSSHVARYTSLSLLYRQTHDIKLVQHVAGHSNIEQTAHYLKSIGAFDSEFEERIRNALESL